MNEYQGKIGVRTNQHLNMKRPVQVEGYRAGVFGEVEHVWRGGVGLGCIKQVYNSEFSKKNIEIVSVKAMVEARALTTINLGVTKDYDFPLLSSN